MKLSDEKAEELLESLEDVIATLRESLSHLSAADLLTFDRILERKLYDIDRAEIEEHTDGSDDGFLYARGFIVAAGRGYYDAVNAKPSVALRTLSARKCAICPCTFMKRNSARCRNRESRGNRVQQRWLA